MRLHRLEFRGLGPFRDSQVIDFTQLSASGLFLLEGPTGSGKSTIIDAIVFALYGGVAGASSSRARLVSHFLTDREEPYAELVFETSAGVFRIRRTPTYELPKSRGEGTTTRQGRVTLTRLPDAQALAGETLSTRVAEAGAEINRIVGLTKEQFVGTIVLPQGEFAAFLRAEGKERRPILQRIFRTEQYERLQQRLVQGRIDAERQRRAAEQALEVALGAFHGAAGSAPTDAGWSSRDLAATPEVLAGLRAAVEQLADRAAGAEAAAAVTAAALDTARKAHAALVARATRRDRVRAALARRDALAQQSGAHEVRVARLAEADRADRVADVLAGALTATAALGEATSRAAAATGVLPPSLAGLELGDLEQALAELRGQCVALVPVVELEASLDGRGAELADLVAAREAARAEVGQVEAALAALPGQLVEAGAARDRAGALAAQVPALEEEVRRSRARHAAATALAAARHAQQVAAEAARTALAVLVDAEAAAAALRTGYLDGLAAELGATLVPREPCPVCGSPEHPLPAVPTDDHVARGDVEQAERAVEAARLRAEELGAALAEHERTLARLGVEAEGLEVDAAALALASASDHLAAAQAAVEQLRQRSRELAALEAERDRLVQERVAAASSAAGLDEACASTARHLAADAAAVERHREGHPTVAERLTGIRATADALEAAVDAGRALQATQAAHEAAVEQLTSGLAREGFTDPANAREAQLAPQERGELERAVRHHEAEAALLDGVLAEPELQDVDPDEAIDVDAPAEQVAAAELEHEGALAQLGEAQSRLASVQVRAAEVHAAALARDETFAGTEALIAVARLADGKNLLSMDLATYVLQQRFDAVVAAANEHLRAMSDGQLQLVAVEEQEGRSQKAGLGLSVVDLRTDRERSPRTLSGGETFYTALALALGLASVVTGEAGGVDLGTLFVDEGFGSLDGETLDDVLAVLTSLRAGGRTVGVVSHVEEMKVRIGERIEVRRDEAHGHSHLRVIA